VAASVEVPVPAAMAAQATQVVRSGPSPAAKAEMVPTVVRVAMPAPPRMVVQQSSVKLVQSVAVEPAVATAVRVALARVPSFLELREATAETAAWAELEVPAEAVAHRELRPVAVARAVRAETVEPVVHSAQRVPLARMVALREPREHRGQMAPEATAATAALASTMSQVPVAMAVPVELQAMAAMAAMVVPVVPA
jgi:hypothetical protein